MALKIKQGDAGTLGVTLYINGEAVTLRQSFYRYE
jgi:hypothetical protein